MWDPIRLWIEIMRLLDSPSQCAEHFEAEHVKSHMERQPHAGRGGLHVWHNHPASPFTNASINVSYTPLVPTGSSSRLLSMMK